MGKKLWIFIFEVHNFEKNVCNLNVWRYTLAICQQIFCSHRNYSAKPRYGVSSAHCVCSCLCYYLMHKAMINQRHAGIAIFVDSYHGWGWWKWRGETATVDFMWQGEIVRHYLVLFMFCQAFLDVSVHLCLHVCFYLDGFFQTVGDIQCSFYLSTVSRAIGWRVFSIRRTPNKRIGGIRGTECPCWLMEPHCSSVSWAQGGPHWIVALPVFLLARFIHVVLVGDFMALQAGFPLRLILCQIGWCLFPGDCGDGQARFSMELFF